MCYKVPQAWVKPNGEPISAEEIANAITTHAKVTCTRRDFVEEQVWKGYLVPVEWPEGLIRLFAGINRPRIQ